MALFELSLVFMVLFLKMVGCSFGRSWGAIRGSWEAPWRIEGDFNVTRFPSEQSTMGRLNSSMRRFSEVINDLELVDLPMSGGNFT